MSLMLWRERLGFLRRAPSTNRAAQRLPRRTNALLRRWRKDGRKLRQQRQHARQLGRQVRSPVVKVFDRSELPLYQSARALGVARVVVTRDARVLRDGLAQFRRHRAERRPPVRKRQHHWQALQRQYYWVHLLIRPRKSEMMFREVRYPKHLLNTSARLTPRLTMRKVCGLFWFRPSVSRICHV